MENNSGYKREDAYSTLENINSWISNIDTKISFALALVGVLVGSIFEKGVPQIFEKIAKYSKASELSGCDILNSILVILLYIFSFSCIICFIFALIARVKNPNTNESIFFFGTIQNMNLQSYKDKVKHMSENAILEDLEEQIHTNSKICTKKVVWYNRGIKLLLITVALWFICCIFQIL